MRWKFYEKLDREAAHRDTKAKAGDEKKIQKRTERPGRRVREGSERMTGTFIFERMPCLPSFIPLRNPHAYKILVSSLSTIIPWSRSCLTLTPFCSSSSFQSFLASQPELRSLLSIPHRRHSSLFPRQFLPLPFSPFLLLFLSICAFFLLLLLVQTHNLPARDGSESRAQAKEEWRNAKKEGGKGGQIRKEGKIIYYMTRKVDVKKVRDR